MVQFPGCNVNAPMDSVRCDRISPAGLPHSAICGSQDTCSSPQLIAALSRPSSSYSSKASTMNLHSLDHIMVSFFQSYVFREDTAYNSAPSTPDTRSSTPRSSRTPASCPALADRSHGATSPNPHITGFADAFTSYLVSPSLALSKIT